MNLTELYESVDSDGFRKEFSSTADAGAAPEGAAMNTAAGGGLSQAELSGISKMEDVLDKEALDKELQNIRVLGLDKYTLGSASYSLDRETEEVRAQLTYSRKDGDNIWRRTVTCDGKTGALLAVYSSVPYSKDRKAAVSAEDARKTAEAFLKELWGEAFAATALYESSPWEEGSRSSAHSFQFAQKENGYFFPENSLHVAVDMTDGSISRLDRTWTEDVVFDSAEGIVDAAAGLNAWFRHYAVALAYRSIPVKLDPGMPEAVPLIDKGYSYFYQLKLSYALEEKRPASGVDAKSGSVVYPEIKSTGALSYSDTADHWAAKEIRLAAKAGWVNGNGNTFNPDAYITRAEVMTIVNRMLDRTPDKDHMLPDMKKWTDNPEDAWYYEAVQEATNEHDYTRDETAVESWTLVKDHRDWAALELGWAANGGAAAPQGETETQGLPDGI